MIDASRFSHLTFDCYGTLIDWESGILRAVRSVLRRHSVEVPDEEILTLYARLEMAQEVGEYRRYGEVLGGVMRCMGENLGFDPSEEDLRALPESVGQWPPFGDTVESLRRLQRRYKLVILSNIDDVMFADTAKALRVPFEEVITAQGVGSYKPAPGHFHLALERLGVERESVLHVAQSLFHDHVPAKALGWTTVWVNRRSLVPGSGATPVVESSPDLEVPDMASLAQALGV